jgi:hypothetical protein
VEAPITKHLVAASALAFLIAGFITAATPSSGSEDADTGTTPTTATLICRPAMPGESGNATMTKSSITLTCRTVAIAMKLSDGKMMVIGDTKAKDPLAGPDLSKALTPGQIADTCARYFEKVFNVTAQQ